MKIITNAADIDVGNIPERAIDDIARGVLEALEIATQNKEFMRKYEEWKQKRGAEYGKCKQTQSKNR